MLFASKMRGDLNCRTAGFAMFGWTICGGSLVSLYRYFFDFPMAARVRRCELLKGKCMEAKPDPN